MATYLMHAETREQLIDLLEAIGRVDPQDLDIVLSSAHEATRRRIPADHRGFAAHDRVKAALAGASAEAVNILPNIKSAPVVDDARAKVLEAIHTDPIVHAAYVMGQQAIDEGFRDALPVAERARIAREERAAAEAALAPESADPITAAKIDREARS